MLDVRPDGLPDHVDPRPRCPAYGCKLPVWVDHVIEGGEGLCYAHGMDVGVRFRRWLDSPSLKGPGRSFRCARMHWDGTAGEIPPHRR